MDDAVVPVWSGIDASAGDILDEPFQWLGDGSDSKALAHTPMSLGGLFCKSEDKLGSLSDFRLQPEDDSTVPLSTVNMSMSVPMMMPAPQVPQSVPMETALVPSSITPVVKQEPVAVPTIVPAPATTTSRRRAAAKASGNGVKKAKKGGPKKKELTESEKERKRLQRLLDNRVSAQEARERKKAYVEGIEVANREMEGHITQLQHSVVLLEKENQALRCALANAQGRSSVLDMDGFTAMDLENNRSSRSEEPLIGGEGSEGEEVCNSGLPSGACIL